MKILADRKLASGMMRFGQHKSGMHMCTSNIEKPDLRHLQTPASRYRFFHRCVTMLMAVCTTIAIDAAQAADGLPGADAQTELTADQKFQQLIDAGIFSPADETLTPGEEILRAELRKIVTALLESFPSTGPLPDVMETPGFEVPAFAPILVKGIDVEGQFEGGQGYEVLVTLVETLSETGALEGVVLPDTGALDDETWEQFVELLSQELQREEQLNDAYQANQNEFPYVAAGVVTPVSSWPTALNATYNGRIAGALTDSTPVTGSVTMAIDFAQINSMVPNIPGSIVFDNGKGSASFDLVQMGGYVGNGMTGTYNGEAMTGFMKDGQFYGPAANEIAGTWDMTTSSVSGSGTYAAKR
jgi:hypothetical protein